MNRFIEFNYHDEASPAIDEYETKETVSIDTMLEPFLASTDQLEDHLKKAKFLPNMNTQHGLNEDQIAAVYLYADDWSENSLHRQLNQALQSGNKETIKPWLGFLKLLNSALEKLPTVKGTIYRGLPKNIETQLKDKSEIVLWQYVSCSTSSGIINSILDENSIVCSIESLSAKNITGYTPYSADFEVLLLPGTFLHIKSTNCFEEINVVNDTEMTSLQETCETENDDKTNKSVIIFSAGNYYKATYVSEKKQGHGIYHNMNDVVAENQEADDRANGEGACVFKNGDCFVGTYKQGVRQGFGILYRKTGSIELGEWVDDELTEKYDSKSSSSGEKYSWKDQDGTQRWYGIYYDSQGNRFVGNIDDNHKAHGLGVRFWNDNSCYQGDFQNDKKHGYGIYRDEDRAIYRGLWVNDEMNGLGKITWKSKTKFEGSFKDGKRHGQGKLTLSSNESQEGNWENDKYVGENDNLIYS